MADMKALQVTRHGHPGEVLAVADDRAPRARARRGAGQGRRGLAELQRHRPLPGQPGLGPHAPPVHARHGRVRRGRRRRRGRRVVARQAGRRHHQERARWHRRVRHRRRHLGLRCSRRLRRRRGHRLPADLPDLAPRPLQAGTTAGGRDPGGPLGRQRSRHGRHPTGQGRRRPGHRRGRRAREGRALHVAGSRPGHRPHGRGLRRGGPGRHRRCRAPTWSTT